MMWLKSKLFYIVSILFVIFIVLIFWKVFPPLLNKLSLARAQSISLDDQIQRRQQYVNLINSLQTKRNDLDLLYSEAGKALPITTSSDVLLLETDGLLKDLGINGLTVTTPVSSSSAPVAPTVASDSAKPAGSAGGSVTATKVAPSSKNSITLSGTITFDQLLSLLTRLRSFSRWNRVNSIDLSGTGTLNLTLSLDVYSNPSASKTFSGADSQFLSKAATTFNSLVSYATLPDIKTEGNFGRTNPFAPR